MTRNFRTKTIISPWTGEPTEAVVNLDTNMVIAAHGATCKPFFLAAPDEIFKGKLQEAVAALPAPDIDIALDDKIETGLAALIDPNPTGCNVCGEPLHMGCCNPGRPAQHHAECRALLGSKCNCGPGMVIVEEHRDPPFALTDAHVRELERAIRAEGYTILIDPDCNITLEKFT